jgi:hypothetical protein
MKKKNSKKLSEVLNNSGAVDQIYIDLKEHNFVLVRENDNYQVPGTVIKFIEWNENGTFRLAHDEPAVGRSIIIDPGPYGGYRWMTTTITEVVSPTQFKTQNSNYNLYKL